MKKYVALLRGINISGKNKVSMEILKEKLAEMGLSNVQTYMNSGNVLFESEENECLSNNIEQMIAEVFGCTVPVLIIELAKLKELVGKAPSEWGHSGKEAVDNLIFMLDDTDAKEIANKIGEPSEGLEQIWIVDNAIFWKFDRKYYQKANWWKKTASKGIGEHLTIRTSNTIYAILKKGEE